MPLQPDAEKRTRELLAQLKNAFSAGFDLGDFKDFGTPELDVLFDNYIKREHPELLDYLYLLKGGDAT